MGGTSAESTGVRLGRGVKLGGGVRLKGRVRLGGGVRLGECLRVGWVTFPLFLLSDPKFTLSPQHDPAKDPPCG